MGQGGHIYLCNGTEHTWRLGEVSHKGMHTWDTSFPSEIQPGTTVSVRVEWNDNIFHATSKDWANASYDVGGKVFVVHAQYRDGDKNIAIEFKDDFSTYCQAGSSQDLGWAHDGRMNFIIAGTKDTRIWNNVGTACNLVFDQLPVIGQKKLTEICVPGSHDAGMWTISSSTFGAREAATRTQKYDIKGQLEQGSRYFDIRPMIHKGIYTTGHFSHVTGLGYQGAFGGTIDQIIAGVNAFTKDRWEPIILALSHDYQADDDFRDFTLDEWEKLIHKMCDELDDLYEGTNPSPMDVPLNDLIKTTKRSAVIIAVQAKLAAKFPSLLDIHPAVIAGSHVGGGGSSGPYNYDELKTTEFASMKDYAHGNYFYLAWTIMQTNAQAAVPGTDSIEDKAEEPREKILDILSEMEKLATETGAECDPSIISLDFIQNCDPATLSYAINMRVHGQ